MCVSSSFSILAYQFNTGICYYRKVSRVQKEIEEEEGELEEVESVQGPRPVQKQPEEEQDVAVHVQLTLISKEEEERVGVLVDGEGRVQHQQSRLHDWKTLKQTVLDLQR